MGTDDLFKKRRQQREQRKHEFKSPRANSFLIVGVNTAINNAKRRMASFRNGIDKPSHYDPGTMVYKLVEELKRYLEEK
jgi:hypothetical protein